MKKHTDFWNRTEAELASDMIDLSVWAAENPKKADHFWTSFEFNPCAKRYTNLVAAREAGLLEEYNEYTARRVAYNFSVDNFDLWHSWYLHNNPSCKAPGQ